MQIYKIYSRYGFANSYVLTEDGKRAVIIDPAIPLEPKLSELKLKIEYVLLTHCHFDHVAGVAGLQKLGAKVICLAEEKPLFGTSADVYDLFGAVRESFSIDKTVQDGEKFELCGISFEAIHTPGHTAGSVCYLVKDGDKKHLFVGDTLFENSIGRTDFPTGDIGQMRKSLKKLKELEDMPVYSGHGEDTTIQTERKNNPFLQDV